MTPDAPSRFVGTRRRAILVLLALCVAGLWYGRSGVAVHVRNDETFAIRGVEVRTSAGAYVLGDMDPGDATSTTVGALGESSVRLAWTHPDGAERAADAGVYFEGTPQDTGMYGGTVDFVVRGGTASARSDVGTRILGVFSRGTPPRARR
jgi:hypothetical protein